MKRFSDDGKYYHQIGGNSIIACPKCQKPVDFDGSIRCIHCGYSKVVSAPTQDLFYFISYPGNYLTIPCCGNELTAPNLAYLDFLEGYVGADLRERVPNINKSIISRLPQWIKDKHNREEILKCIKKLRLKLQKEGYVPNTKKNE